MKIHIMAATYRRVVTTVNCYSSVVIDRRLQQAVHYCTGACQIFKQGVICIVAHHSVCAELIKAPTHNFGSSDVTQRLSIPGTSLALTGDEEYHHQVLPSHPRLKKSSSVQSTGSLKDITGEAINLASGKMKEFSFEKLRNSSNQVTYRKGRKVKSDPFNRRSLDYDLIYGHFSNDENCPPPFGLSQNSSPEEKWQVNRTSLEGNMNSAIPLPGLSFSEDNFITQILEKHKLDGSSSGDIKMCLDILLKCSEDLKKCTDIIKQCIKKKSPGDVSGGNGNDPLASSEMIYMNLMTRFSSYLKKLPFEFRQSGLSESGDMVELINSLAALQQSHFPPIFGNEQPPRYEDVVCSPSSMVRQSLPLDLQGNQNSSDSSVSAKPSPIATVDVSSNALHVSNQRGNFGAQASSHLLSVNPSVCTSPIETLCIVEESDRGKVLGSIPRNENRGCWENKKIDPAIFQRKASPTVVQPVTMAQASLQATSAPPGFDSAVWVSKGESRKKNQEEIDKLLLDLEHFSQKMETTLKETNTKDSDATCLRDVSLSLENKGKACSIADKSASTSLSKLIEANGHKMEEDDKTLLLRILESIEDFAQELVEFRMGKGSLSKEKEVMHILQETLATPSMTAVQQSYTSTIVKQPIPAIIQQTPEVVKVRLLICFHNLGLVTCELFLT